MIEGPEKKALRDLEAWIAPGLALRPSRIHGIGVFATQSFSKGDLLMRLGGFLLKRELRNTGVVIPSTSSAVAEDVIISEIEGSTKDLSDYLNHSCDPNAGFLDAVTIVASRRILLDEEVTIDYAYCEADETWVLRNACCCKSSTCRVNVTGSDWKNTSQSERFLSWASPFIKRRINLLHEP